jgi:signal peptidase
MLSGPRLTRYPVWKTDKSPVAKPVGHDVNDLGIPIHEEESSDKKYLKEWGPTVVAIIVIVVVLNVILPAVLSTRSPLMVVVSESMNPTLMVGDIILVRGKDTYELDDIVVYRTPLYQKPIVHRIIGMKNGNYVTKGDNNNFPDPGTIAPRDGVAPEDVQGKVVIVVPKLGYPKYILSKILGGVFTV